jgi:hypothetical protein
MITYDVKDLYVIIAIDETLKVTENHLLKNNDKHKIKQIITILKTILAQNFFTFHNTIYHPNKGEAMESPISGTMAEIFLQYIENRHLNQLLDSKNIILYTRYVDDIFIIYDITHTTADSIYNYINNIHNYLQLNPTYENNTQINFLDLCIISKTNKLEIDIYRKPTTTDITINYLSNHPIEPKLAAYRYHIDECSYYHIRKKDGHMNGKPHKTLNVITTSPTNL